MWQSSLWHAESLVVACELLVAACGILFSDQGWNPGPLDWEHGVLATGPPGSPHHIEFICGSAPISSSQWHSDLLLGHFLSLPFYTLRGMVYQIILLP